MRARHSWTSFSEVSAPASKAWLMSAIVSASKSTVFAARAGASVAATSTAAIGAIQECRCMGRVSQNWSQRSNRLERLIAVGGHDAQGPGARGADAAARQGMDDGG